MKKILPVFYYYFIALFFSSLLFACNNSSNSGSTVNTDTTTSASDTVSMVKPESVQPDTTIVSKDSLLFYAAEDTVFGTRNFTSQDTLDYLIEPKNHAPASSDVCKVAWEMSDVMQHLHNASFIAFQPPTKIHIPIKYNGVLVAGLHADNPEFYSVQFPCFNLGSTTTVTSTGAHSIWLRRLFVFRYEFDDLLTIARAKFPDLDSHPENYQLLFIPDSNPGIQHDQIHHRDEQYVNGSLLIRNKNNGQETTAKTTHPCPYC